MVGTSAIVFLRVRQSARTRRSFGKARMTRKCRFKPLRFVRLDFGFIELQREHTGTFLSKSRVVND
jgi:hypothetical protein